MNYWIIGAIVFGVLLVGGVFLAGNFVTADVKPQGKIECSSCGNSCTLENNCGLSSCGAVSGGNWGCGR